MTIAIDYDGTYTSDVALWNWFIVKSIPRHRVIIVTARPECCPIENYPHIDGVPCYYTSGAKKRDYMRCQGIAVDVWIDDRPEDI